MMINNWIYGTLFANTPKYTATCFELVTNRTIFMVSSCSTRKKPELISQNAEYHVKWLFILLAKMINTKKRSMILGQPSIFRETLMDSMDLIGASDEQLTRGSQLSNGKAAQLPPATSTPAGSSMATRTLAK